ncbi:ParB/RepB/Spo0J family partition protein (plasmid) [Asticcacaulis sp. DW145]|uniref:ParB/RepB/Spo0J family partition protein n=1 Tax=Asticcacaulis sp. DW145 TaxID=3095608 RepID=UPI0030904607|nr:ParB/RepB/Spo0J family partition protein [Asticcacaulis sp. DW145]
MPIDLSALDQPFHPVGTPLHLPLSQIDEDPDQPRKIFTPEDLTRIAESIRRRGVRSPVSVRPHPTEPGRYMLNHGARRYRGSAMAGNATIPAIIDETHTDYDQVVENLQRDNLKPMELAEFIGRKIAAGDKKAFIARQLGVDASIITQHLALVDPPACIREVYASGRCQSPKTLYDLRMLYEAYPDQIIVWCSKAGEVTRRSVAKLGDALKSAGSAVIGEPDKAGASPARFRRRPDAPDGQAKAVGALVTDPQVWVDCGGRPAQLILERRPPNPDQVYVRIEGAVGDEAVSAGACRLIAVKSGTS